MKKALMNDDEDLVIPESEMSLEEIDENRDK